MPIESLDENQFIQMIQQRDYEFAAHGYFSYPVEQRIRLLCQQLEAMTQERNALKVNASNDYEQIQDQGKQLAALRLVWTTDKPTKPGWYWWRASKNGTICIRYADPSSTLNEGQWAGPIAEPEELVQEEGAHS